MELWALLLISLVVLKLTLPKSFWEHGLFGPRRRARVNTSAVEDLPYVADINVRLALNDAKTHFMKPFIEALAPKGVPGGDDAECVLYRDDRDRHFEDSEKHEPLGVGIDFWAPEVSDEFEAACVRVLESLGAPKGSQLIAPNAEPQRYIPFGVTEGMGVYIDTVGLPARVYKECSVDEVLKRFPDLLRDRGKVLSHWVGQKETALYCYGPSYQAMADSIAPFVAEYPLLNGCRIVQIA